MPIRYNHHTVYALYNNIQVLAVRLLHTCLHKTVIQQMQENQLTITLQSNVYVQNYKLNGVKVELYSCPEKVISELRGITRHVEKHSATCHPTQVNVPRLTAGKQVGTQFMYSKGTEG